jgi:hypothetical protein
MLMAGSPLATRTVDILSTQKASVSAISGMLNPPRWMGKALRPSPYPSMTMRMTADARCASRVPCNLCCWRRWDALPRAYVARRLGSCKDILSPNVIDST